MIAGRLDVDQMLTEMTAEQLAEWEAALDFVGVDSTQRQLARLAKELHYLMECFKGHDEAAMQQAYNNLPTVRELMGLYTFDEPAVRLPFSVQSQEEIAKTLLRLK